MIQSALVWALIFCLATPVNPGGFYFRSAWASAPNSQQIQARRSALSAVRALIRNDASNDYGNTEILGRADRAYAQGNLKQGDILLARFVLQHEKRAQLMFNKTNLLPKERMALVGILKKHAPEQLKKIATDTVLTFRQAIAAFYEAEKKERGLTEGLSVFRNQLLDDAVDRSLGALGRIHICIGSSDASVAEAFFRDFEFFSYEMQHLVDAIYNRFESAEMRSRHLAKTYARFAVYGSLRPASHNEQEEYHAHDLLAAQMDADDMRIRETWNRDTAKAAGTSGALTAAVIGLTAVTLLSIPLGPEATAPIAAITAKTGAAATALWLGGSAYNVLDHFASDGSDAIQNTEVAMDIALIALTAVTFGAAKFGSAALNKLAQSPLVETNLSKLSGIAQKTGLSAFVAKTAPYLKATGSGAVMIGSLGLGGWMIADAEAIAQKTGQSVAQVRLEGVLICLIGILGGKQFYTDLRAVAGTQARAEYAAARASRSSSGAATRESEKTLTGVAARQEAEAQKKNILQKMNDCLAKMPLVQQSQLASQLFLENLGGNALIKITAVGAGWLPAKDVPAEALMWMNRNLTAKAKTMVSIQPQDRYFVRWYKYAQLNTLSVPVDGMIYVLATDRNGDPAVDALQKRVGFNFAWSLASPALVGIPAERFFSGWACLANSPLQRVGNLITRSVAGWAMGGAYHGARFIITGS